ncbi:MAG: hypothetical protein B7733_12700 [Myxococcales bacterium FL481]|nr:MAG: hypothetical protein B7733_12700 [Myxococcales bacterium FL481]
MTDESPRRTDMRMTKLEVLRELRAALKAPDRLGDVAVLKGELAGGGAVRSELEARLAAMDGPFPQVDIDFLRTLPPASLGRHYAEFLDQNRLQPFRLTPRISQELLARHRFIARYGLVHDVYHVLTGFDASLAGELGVWAFVAAQRYSWKHWIAVLVACVVYPLLSPRQIGQHWRCLRRGRAMGQSAEQLITVPFERLWERRVDELRRELRIEPLSVPES